MTGEITDDLFLGGKLRLKQPGRGHRVGGDAALLAAAARSRLTEDAVVADLGAGVGAVGLALGIFGAARVTLVEIDAALAGLAAENADRNFLATKVDIVQADVASVGRPANPLGAHAFSLVAMNPPFDDVRRFRASPDAAKARAHADDGGVLEVWVAAAARLLSGGSSLVMIHRPEALQIILGALAGRFGAVRIRPVHPRRDAPAARVLVAARLGRRAPLALLPPLVMHDEDGGFTDEADAAQRGEAAIPLG